MKRPDQRPALQAQQQLPLTELPSGQTAVIIKLESGQGAQLRLRSLGIHEGQRVRKISRIGKIGPVVVLVDRTQIAVGHGMAKKILVQVHE
jgi:ferrous iron transport protein A